MVLAWGPTPEHAPEHTPVGRLSMRMLPGMPTGLRLMGLCASHLRLFAILSILDMVRGDSSYID